MKTFYAWLLCQQNRPDEIGDLARDVKEDSGFPIGASPIAAKAHLELSGACDGAIIAIGDAANEFAGWCRHA